jgi:hypothetical protein
VKSLSCGVNLDVVKIVKKYLAEHDYNTLDEVFLRVLARGPARAKRGGDVDGVLWYTKYVHYTLVWICLWN